MHNRKLIYSHLSVFMAFGDPIAIRQTRGSTACNSFLSNFFGGGSTAKKTKSITTVEDNLGEEAEEVVIADVARDDGTRAMIVFLTNGRVKAKDLEDLCVKVDWPARPLHKVEAALRNSYLVCSLVLRICKPRTDGPQQVDILTQDLIGLARATSDHAFNATIWDVLIDPEYQGRSYPLNLPPFFLTLLHT